MLELYATFDSYAKGLTKHSRYTLGTKISNEILIVLEYAILALNKTEKSRLAILGKIDTRIHCLKLFMRLLYTTKGIDEKAYLHLSEVLVKLSRMNGGWIAASKRKQLDSDV